MPASLAKRGLEAKLTEGHLTGFTPVTARIVSYLAAAFRPAPRLRLVPSPIDLASVRRCSA